MSNKGYLGLDGKYYDDTLARNKADSVVEEQEKQTKLLEQQNEYLNLQSEITLFQLEQEKKLAQEQHEHETKLEQERHEHEKEILMLKRFDEVSIPLNVFQNFKNELFNKNDIIMSEEDMLLLTKIKAKEIENLANFTEETEKVAKMIKGNSEDAINQKRVKYTEKYKHFQYFINGIMELDELSDKEIDELNLDGHTMEIINTQKNKSKVGAIILSIFLGIELLVMFFMALSTTVPSFMHFLIICTFSLIVATVPNAIQLTELKKIFNETINKKIIIERQEQWEEQRNHQKNEVAQHILDKYNSLFTELVEKKLNYLFDFRINHYNMQIEKLFYDSGLVKECEEKNLTFRVIDRSEIKNEGTFDDYFLFFNNFKQGYSKYAKKK